MQFERFFVNPYISSTAYIGKDGISRSYVVNEKLHTEFLFEGIVSDLWNIILSNNELPYETLNQFVIKNELEDEIDSFLDELNFADLITYGSPDDLFDDILLQNTKMTLLNDKEELQNFLIEKKKWLYDNNFLYQLIFEYDESNFNLDVAKRVVNDAQKIGVNVISLNVTSSKITDKFLEFTKYIREKLISLELTIDPDLLFSEKILFRKIANLYPHRIIIKLYSSEAQVHDSIVGKIGHYNKTIQMIEKFQSEEIPVTIKFEQTSENKNAFQGVLEYTNKVGVEILFNDDNINDGVNILNYVYDGYIDSFDKDDNSDSYYMRQKMYVTSEMELFIGFNFDKNVVSLLNKSIIDVWNSIVKN